MPSEQDIISWNKFTCTAYYDKEAQFHVNGCLFPTNIMMFQMRLKIISGIEGFQRKHDTQLPTTQSLPQGISDPLGSSSTITIIFHSKLTRLIFQCTEYSLYWADIITANGTRQSPFTVKYTNSTHKTENLEPMMFCKSI